MEKNETDSDTAILIIRIVYSTVCFLGFIPNAIIIYLFFKNTPKELHSYSVYLLNFAITELICVLSVVMTMSRLFFNPNNNLSIWIVPIGPCSIISPAACEISSALLNACIMNISFLIPNSFLYRYYVVSHGTPRMCTIIFLNAVSLIGPIASVPMQASTVLRMDVKSVPEDIAVYDYFSFDYRSPIMELMQWIHTAGSAAFLVSIVVGFLIMRRLKRYSKVLAPKTIKMHKTLTKALYFHTVVHFVALCSYSLYFLESSHIVDFPYCDVFVNMIYATIPLLNGTVCLYFVPHYHKIISKFITGRSSTTTILVASLSTRASSQNL